MRWNHWFSPTLDACEFPYRIILVGLLMHYSVGSIRLFSLVVLLGLLGQAEDKKLPIETTSNELVEISANVILDPEQIKQALGSDFGGDLVLVRVTVRPLSDRKGGFGSTGR